jgi:DNA-binding transcriptional LysR family regulator
MALDGGGENRNYGKSSFPFPGPTHMTLPDVEAWAIFAKVAETGSFAAAATELGLSGATVSKAIQRLELRIGDRLIHRTSRRFALSDSGRMLAERAARILAEGEAAEAEAQSRTAAPRGRVRLAAPMSFGLRHIAPVLPAFLSAYQEVTVDLQLDDRVVDLVASGVDVAVRIADLPDSSLIARRLCPVQRWVVGSPAYFARHGTPQRPRDLRGHACLSYLYLPSGEIWRFIGPDGAEEAVAIHGPLHATNAEALTHAIEAGIGVALQPDFLVWDAVRAGRLMTVLDGWSAPRLALHLVTPSGEPRPPRVSVLLDFLARHFAADTAPWTVMKPGGRSRA